MVAQYRTSGYHNRPSPPSFNDLYTLDEDNYASLISTNTNYNVHSSVGISPPDTPTHNLFPRQHHCRREIWATFLDNMKLDTLSIQVKYEYTLCMFIFHLNGIPCILIFKTCTHEAINWLSTKCEFFTLYRYALLMLTLVTDQACSLVSCSQLGGVK